MLAQIAFLVIGGATRVAVEALVVRLTRGAPDADAYALSRGRAYLARHALGTSDAAGRVRLGGRHAGARASIDEHGRVAIDCPWSGRGPILERTFALGAWPQLLDPLRGIAGVEEVSSDGTTLAIGGGPVLAGRIGDAAERVARVARTERHVRGVLAARGGRLASAGLCVELGLDGVHTFVTRRSVPLGRDACEALRLDVRAARVSASEGLVRIAWRGIPSEAQLAAAEAALGARGKTTPYR